MQAKMMEARLEMGVKDENLLEVAIDCQGHVIRSTSEGFRQ